MKPDRNASRAPVIVKRSRVQGLGLFAARHFTEGELILETGGLRWITEENRLPEGEQEHHCDWLADGSVVLIPEPIRYINHSCDPNSYKRYEQGKRQTIARREIAAGAEITHDYAINGFGDAVWQCQCGSNRCRGTIHANFFRLPLERQIEYLPYLTETYRKAFSDELLRLQAAVAPR